MDPVLWQQIGVAAVCGALLGLERQLEGKPLGVRAGTLVCVATAVFVRSGSLMELNAPGADPTRVLGQVITGVGFLGAGAVMHHGASVQGLTTASTVWLLAAVGVLVGLDRPFDAVGLAVAAVVALRVMLALEVRLGVLRRGSHADAGEYLMDEASDRG